jgi:hypothetical protein
MINKDNNQSKSNELTTKAEANTHTKEYRDKKLTILEGILKDLYAKIEENESIKEKWKFVLIGCFFIVVCILGCIEAAGSFMESCQFVGSLILGTIIVIPIVRPIQKHVKRNYIRLDSCLKGIQKDKGWLPIFFIIMITSFAIMLLTLAIPPIAFFSSFLSIFVIVEATIVSLIQLYILDKQIEENQYIINGYLKEEMSILTNRELINIVKGNSISNDRKGIVQFAKEELEKRNVNYKSFY